MYMYIYTLYYVYIHDSSSFTLQVFLEFPLYLLNNFFKRLETKMGKNDYSMFSCSTSKVSLTVNISSLRN